MKTSEMTAKTLSIVIAFLILSGFSYANDTQIDETQETPQETTEDINVSQDQESTPETIVPEPSKYTLGTDDVIQIDVRRHPEFSGEYTINAEGKIQYKFVGDIPIEGLTKSEVKQELSKILAKFIMDPDIEVTILEYRSKVIFIVGEVGAPGKYYMRADIVSVRDAVVQAGLPTLAAAMRRTRLVRPAKDGKPEFETIDLYKLVYEGQLDLDREMLPGDVLYIPATLFAKVTRVLSPVAAPVGPAGTIERASTGGI